MSRIFDALKKSRPAPERAEASREGVPSPTPLHSVVGRAATPGARATLERGDIVPLGPVAPSDDSVVREMTALRVHIDSLLPVHAPRTLMFLSAQRGEGTSTVTLQFAESLARDVGLRVLLVDAHVVRSSPLLAGARSITRPGRAGVDLLAISDRARRAGSSTPRLVRDLMDAAGPGYDWVVVDAPPLLESPETAPLGALMDGVIIVVQAGRTKRPVLTRATEILRRSGANVLGTVLNRRRLEIPDFLYRRI